MVQRPAQLAGTQSALRSHQNVGKIRKRHLNRRMKPYPQTLLTKERLPNQINKMLTRSFSTADSEVGADYTMNDSDIVRFRKFSTFSITSAFDEQLSMAKSPLDHQPDNPQAEFDGLADSAYPDLKDMSDAAHLMKRCGDSTTRQQLKFREEKTHQTLNRSLSHPEMSSSTAEVYIHQTKTGRLSLHQLKRTPLKPSIVNNQSDHSNHYQNKFPSSQSFSLPPNTRLDSCENSSANNNACATSANAVSQTTFKKDSQRCQAEVSDVYNNFNSPLFIFAPGFEDSISMDLTQMCIIDLTQDEDPTNYSWMGDVCLNHDHLPKETFKKSSADEMQRLRKQDTLILTPDNPQKGHEAEEACFLDNISKDTQIEVEKLLLCQEVDTYGNMLDISDADSDDEEFDPLSSSVSDYRDLYVPPPHFRCVICDSDLEIMPYSHVESIPNDFHSQGDKDLFCPQCCCKRGVYRN